MFLLILTLSHPWTSNIFLFAPASVDWSDEESAILALLREKLWSHPAVILWERLSSFPLPNSRLKDSADGLMQHCLHMASEYPVWTGFKSFRSI